MKEVNNDKIINNVSAVGIIGNVFLSVFKLIAGIVGNSGAMISDAVHSFSDVFATLIAFIGVKLSKKEADADHEYGHERLESAASLILGAILFVTGGGIGLKGFEKILGGNYSQLTCPGTIALVAAVVSIVVKEAMFWYTRHYAKIINSDAFMADAWHHRSDAISSIGSLMGIGGAMLGVRVLDPIASVMICICIFKVAYDIIKDAMDKMMDKSCGEDYEKKMGEFIGNQNGVEKLDILKTRIFGNMIYVDAEIEVNGDLTLTEAHEIAETVHDNVESNFDNIKHIMIHVNPC